ncbi:hypothetical protein ALI22I_13115 [Saccharothrix sp. ALI-22-I]|uniref:CHAT domain-containing protein n=1 Tax=Saccharothrix sp. ALI-22-I TaxID=1933778 RepID=UPI00097BD9B5|nr:CHAT domain-containing protein [Saccharothrix sp. ALI-22-I]ONI90255.1 hypothetical protein ALI22I_13115 [Saccharothrix sp. ALI-22-I]
MVLGRATDPAFTALDSHLTRVRDALPGVSWLEADHRAALLDGLRASQPSLIYLYCHGGIANGVGYVALRLDETPLTSYEFDRGFRRRWRSRPLVLLNGCSTAALGVGQDFPLVGRLLWAGAAGVVGTEVDVREQQACAFADGLLPALLARGATAGEATRDARLALLRAGSGARPVPGGQRAVRRVRGRAADRVPGLPRRAAGDGGRVAELLGRLVPRRPAQGPGRGRRT